MKNYPSIPKITQGDQIIAFDKLDGSQIRAEWTRKNGFSKFGTRTRLLGDDERPLGLAIPLFKEKYGEALSAHFKKKRYNKVTVYFEFYGPNSLAGQHAEGDKFEVTLFDVYIEKKGFVPPREFVKEYAPYGIPKVLYEGKVTQDFTAQVTGGTLGEMTFEGVVCKGGYDKYGNVKMFKIKNRAWLEKLREVCSSEEEFERLA